MPLVIIGALIFMLVVDSYCTWKHRLTQFIRFTESFGARYFSLFLLIFVFAMNGTVYAWIVRAHSAQAYDSVLTIVCYSGQRHSSSTSEACRRLGVRQQCR